MAGCAYLPDGTIVYHRESGSGARVNVLDALGVGPTQLTQDTIAEALVCTVAGVTAVLQMPVMPVGSKVRFVASLADAASILRLRELDQAGVARAITFRDAAGAATAFNTVAPVLDGAAAAFVLANNVVFGAVSGGDPLLNTISDLQIQGAVFGFVFLDLCKIRPNAANLADGWMIQGLGCLSTT